MNGNISTKIAIYASAFFGGFICIIADLIQKSEASAVLLIGDKLGSVGLPGSKLFAIGIVLLIATILPLIFDPKTKKHSFYTGASVLAVLMTITPYQTPPGLKTQPNSVQINLSCSSNGKKLKGAMVTAIPLSGVGKKSRSKMRGSSIKFYLDEGKYKLVIELSGYEAVTRIVTLKEGSPPENLSIQMKPSGTPLFLQRIFR